MQSSVCIHHDGISFSVEYATELLGVVSILCQDQDTICDAGTQRCNAEYRAKVIQFFQAWRDSELTQLLERLSDDYNFNYDAPVDLMLQRKHQQPIDLNQLCLHRKPIPQVLFDRFLEQLDRFEAESNFRAFYDSHRSDYEAALRHFIMDYDAYRPLDYLNDYLGLAPGMDFHVNLMFGITNSNYGVSVGKHLYANLRPNSKTRFAPLPDYSYSLIYWTTLIVHEFAHPFVNRIFAKFRQQIGRVDITPYSTILKEMMYGDSLETYINETIIRTIECMYVKAHFPSCHEEYVQEYEEDGFIRIRQTEQILGCGKNLESVFADILDLF